MHAISIINQKGGVAKTTTAQAIAFGLGMRGFKVLVIDLDPQGNLTQTLEAESDLNIFNLLSKKCSFEDACKKKKYFDILPSSPMLSTIDSILKETGKEYRLKEILDVHISSYTDMQMSTYDYILIDTPPQIGLLTINALVASNKVLVPIQADVYSLQGVSQLAQTIESVQKYCNKDLDILGLLLTRFNSRTVLAKDMESFAEEMSKKLNTKLLKSKIRECNALKEAIARKKSIFSYSKSSNASMDYYELIDEILEELRT